MRDDISAQTRYRGCDIQCHTGEPGQVVLLRPTEEAKEVDIIDDEVFVYIPELLQFGVRQFGLPCSRIQSFGTQRHDKKKRYRAARHEPHYLPPFEMIDVHAERGNQNQCQTDCQLTAAGREQNQHKGSDHRQIKPPFLLRQTEDKNRHQVTTDREDIIEITIYSHVAEVRAFGIDALQRSQTAGNDKEQPSRHRNTEEPYILSH